MFCKMFMLSFFYFMFTKCLVFYVHLDIKDINHISEGKDAYLKIAMFLLITTI